jgi:hypothetical protein
VAEWQQALGLAPQPVGSQRGGAGLQDPAENAALSAMSQSSVAEAGGAGLRQLRWAEGRSLSYGVGVPYHLATDILRGLIGAGADASEEETWAALRRTCQSLLDDPATDAPLFLAHMMGLPLDGQDASRLKYLDGPALQGRYVAAYRQVLEASAREKPTILFAEDVHWADPSSVELGLQLLPMAAEVPLVIVLAARPDRDSSGWRLIAGAREVPGASALELHLAPLAEADSRQLVDNLLEQAALPEGVRRLILAKAEGNPFFVEEVIRMLIEDEVLARDEAGWRLVREVDDIEIPDTLQGVIMARIDRLPEETKHVLQVASVIGRQFQVRVLEMVLAQQGSQAAGQTS